MKYFFTFLLFLTITAQVDCQVLYSQDFESGLGDMILVDVDKRTPATSVAVFSKAWNHYELFENNFSAVSVSWYAPPGKSDDWMITPVITGITENTVMYWKGLALDGDFRDGYEVRVSETGGSEIADFTKLILTVGMENDEITDRAVGLKEFAGKDIRIAFRNISNDMFLLMIDDILVVNADERDLKVNSFSAEKYVPANKEATVSYEVVNNGSNQINSFSFLWSDGQNTYNQEVNGIVLKVGERYSASIKFTPTEAKLYNLSFEVKDINGSADQKIDNNLGDQSMVGVSKEISRKMIAEEGTGTWCTWCPRGAVFMKLMASTYPNEFVGIAVHNNDPMAFAEYDTPFGEYIGGYPSVSVNRATEVDPADLPAYLNNTLKKQFSPIEINATQSVNNNVLSVNGDVTFFSNIEEAKFNVVAVILEDNVRGTAAGYAQVNGYSGGGQGPMGGYENLPNPVPASQMVYQEVARALPFGFSGNSAIIPGALTNAQTVPFSFTYTIPNNFVTKNVYAAVFITDDAGVIVGGTKTDALYTSIDEIEILEDLIVYPNPAEDMAFMQMNLSNDAQVQISLVNMLGQVISSRNYGRVSGNQIFPVGVENLQSGLYTIQIQIDNKVTSRKLTVK
jgi:hypothetical protein